MSKECLKVENIVQLAIFFGRVIFTFYQDTRIQFVGNSKIRRTDIHYNFAA